MFDVSFLHEKSIGNSLQPFVKRIHSHESRNNHVNAVCEQYNRGKKVLDPVSIKCWQGMRKDGCSARKLAKLSNVARKFGYDRRKYLSCENISASRIFSSPYIRDKMESNIKL